MECTAESSVPKDDTSYYRGVVQSCGSGLVQILVSVPTSCGSCNARQSGCHAGLNKNKGTIIEVKSKTQFAIGEQLTLASASKHTTLALALVFVVPIVLLCSGLLIANYFLGTELIGGLISLGLLVVYFSMLYPLRKKIAHHFEFVILASSENQSR